MTTYGIEAMYKVVGLVKGIWGTGFRFEPGAESRAPRLVGRSSKPLRPPRLAKNGPRGEAQFPERRFVLSRNLLRRIDKARLLKNPSGRIELPQPCIRSSTSDHDSISELPFLLPGEAGRSINLSTYFRPPSASSGYSCDVD